MQFLFCNFSSKRASTRISNQGKIPCETKYIITKAFYRRASGNIRTIWLVEKYSVQAEEKRKRLFREFNQRKLILNRVNLPILCNAGNAFVSSVINSRMAGKAFEFHVTYLMEFQPEMGIQIPLPILFSHSFIHLHLLATYPFMFIHLFMYIYTLIVLKLCLKQNIYVF